MPSAKDVFAEAYRNPTDWMFYEDDFLAEGASNVPDTFKWDIIKDSSAATTVEADQIHGVALLSSAATTNDDGNLLQSLNEFIKPTTGKRFAFECRLKSADADQMDIMVGLAQRSATNPENCLTADNSIAFHVVDENASILCKSRASDIETSKDSDVDLADDTYVKLGFAYDGAGNIDYHVNDSPVARISSNIPATELAVILYQLSGNNTGTHTMRVDYVRACSER